MSQLSQETWIVTDGRAGMENQCLGLAEALGVEPIVKRVKQRPLWNLLCPYLRFNLAKAYTADSDKLTPPWPRLLIASGRASVAASLYVRAQSKRDGGSGTYTIQIQHPHISSSFFDLVITPQHDGLSGANILSTRGSMHRITRDRLASEAPKYVQLFEKLPRPWIGVIIGGKSSAYDLTSAEIPPLLEKLQKVAHESGGSLIVTPSRRTGADNIHLLQKGLEGIPHYFYNLEGVNPYFGILGLADYLLVTSDSTNLVSEACSTGKPVYIIDLPGGSPKFNRFHKRLRDDGLTRPFTGVLENWTYEPLADVKLAADRIQKELADKG